MARVDDFFAVSTNTQDRRYTPDQVIAVMDGTITGGGGGPVGRATQFATYITRSVNPQTVFYTALDTSDLSVLVARTQAGVTKIMDGPGWTMYGYDQPMLDGMLDWIAVWDEGVASDFTSEWEVVGAGSGIGGGGGGGSGFAHAAFTLAQSTSTLITVDATSSIATSYAWKLDGVSRPETDSVLTFGPLTVGSHEFILTVGHSADGSVSQKTHTIDVAWVGEPFDAARIDRVNGVAGAGVDLPVWSTLDPIGPFQAIYALNEAEGYPDVGDGQERIHDHGDGSWSFYVATTDQLLVASSTRVAQQWNDAYDGRIGLPGEVQNIDVCGTGLKDGSTGTARFYRVEVMIPTTMLDGGTQVVPYLGLNNAFETEVPAASNGQPFFATGLNAEGTYWRHYITPATNGVAGTQKICAHQPIVLNQWQNWVYEILWDLDPSVGYVRIYKDGVALAAGSGSGIDPGMPVGTDGQGRYFTATARTDVNGDLVQNAFQYEVYRNYAYIVATPGDTTARQIRYRNAAVGPSLASVLAI